MLTPCDTIPLALVLCDYTNAFEMILPIIYDITDLNPSPMETKDTVSHHKPKKYKAAAVSNPRYGSSSLPSCRNYSFKSLQKFKVPVILVNDNTVSIPDLDLTFLLDAGEYRNTEFRSSNANIMVTCSKSCLVVQYSIHDKSGSTPPYLYSGPFMIALTPNKLFSSDVVFTTPIISTIRTWRQPWLYYGCWRLRWTSDQSVPQ